MQTEKRQIYSNHYPKRDMEAVIAACLEAEEDEEEGRAVVEALHTLREERAKKRPDPVRLEESDRFIALAKTLSQQGKVDLDIYRTERYVQVVFSFDYEFFFGVLKQSLVELIVMSDCVRFLTQDGALGMQMILDYWLLW